MAVKEFPLISVLSAGWATGANPWVPGAFGAVTDESNSKRR
jgi:hypothetical protein